MIRPIVSTNVATLLMLIGATVFAPPACSQKNQERARPSANSSDEVEAIDDSKLVSAIESQLFGAKAVDANNIDVNARNGIVELSGELDDMLSRERAVRIAEMTKGVKSVIDRTTVRPSERNEQLIRLDVVAALSKDPATDSWEISVSANDRTMVLEGTVQSNAERKLAGKVAKSVRGVQQVSNQLKLDTTAERTDADIQTDIEQRLNWDIRLDDELVDVRVDAGAVKLVGAVGSAYEKSLAAEDAWVNGVQSVDIEGLAVQWWSRDEMQRSRAWQDLSDEEIRQAVERSILYDPRVYSFNPEVRVEDGIVVLRGIVDNVKAKRAAAKDAANTVGVRRVQNLLKVRPENPQSDDKLKEEIAAALRRDVMVDRYDIGISVDSGVAILRGEVDSYFEMEQMEDIAGKVNGVKDVNNLLQVSYDPVVSYSIYDWDPTLYDYDFDYQTTRTKPDPEIKESIESQIWWSPMVSYDQVNISVDDGVATLTGTVDSWSERQSAAENAIEGGAVKVINELAVSY